MSGLQEIEVVIKPDGKVEVIVRGVRGGTCRQLTREMERYLGGRVVERRHTDEYHQQEHTEERSESARLGKG
jgi:hypothetical protein